MKLVSNDGTTLCFRVRLCLAELGAIAVEFYALTFETGKRIAVSAAGNNRIAELKIESRQVVVLAAENH